MASSTSELRRLRREGKRFLKQAQQLRKKHGKRLSKDAAQALDAALDEVARALGTESTERIGRALKSLDAKVDKHLGRWRKSTFREYVEAIGLAVVFALLLRAFLVEAFIIPSGSMEPTLQEGDRLFVNKFIYGVRIPMTTTRVIDFGAPDRGDIVVFVFPREEAREHTRTLPPHRQGCVDQASLHEAKDYIKRVIGLPGDRIKMVNNRVFVNGEAIAATVVKETPGEHGFPYHTQFRETYAGKTYTTQHYGTDTNFAIDKEVVVKPDHVFVMGDNRDNSSDSRCWGQVPITNIKGKAMIIWLSTGPGGWRWDRIGKVLE